MSRVFTAASGVAGVLGTIAILGLMFQTVASALLRTFANAPISGTLELVGDVYQPLIVMAGLVTAQQALEHIDAPFIFDKLSDGHKRVWEIVNNLVVALVALVIVRFTYVQAQHDFDIRLTAGIDRVPVWPVSFVVPVAFAVYALQLLYRTFQLVRGAETLGEPTNEELMGL